MSTDHAERPEQANQPYLCIPYWDHDYPTYGNIEDTGEVRPVWKHPGVIWYLCPGIEVLTPYVPGSPLSVQIAVRNSVMSNNKVQAVVTLWWSLPSTSFITLPHQNRLAIFSVDMPPQEHTVNTLLPPLTIPSSADHVCLIARVFHPLDRVKLNPDGTEAILPGSERHWAQHNICHITPGPDGFAMLSFFTANPLREKQEFEISVRPIVGDQLYIISRIARAEPYEVEASINLNETAKVLMSEQEATMSNSNLRQVIDVGAQRLNILRLSLAHPIPTGHFAAFEVAQISRSERHFIGGLALIVHASSRERRLIHLT